MPLKLTRRHGSPNWYIRGSVRGVCVDESTGTGERRAAEEILTLRAAEILKRTVHGDSATRTFAEAALSYMEAGGDRTHLTPILKHFARTRLASIGQAEIEAAAAALKPGASPATLNRHVYTPIAAVLHHAARKKWCARPVIARPKQPKGRVRWVTHEEAERLIAAAHPNLRPLVTFLFCTGCRLSEALYLDWRDVDLGRGHVSILNREAGGTAGTKNDESRGVPLHPKAVAALANLPHRTGKVFRRHYGWTNRKGKTYGLGEAYADRKGAGGGQIKTAWRSMLKAAKIDNFTPHDCRHTFATWHYIANRDLKALMEIGGWKDERSVMRYIHVNTAHLAPSVGRIWGNAGDLLPGRPANPLKHRA